jgi:hypothetical protein
MLSRGRNRMIHGSRPARAKVSEILFKKQAGHGVSQL